MLLPAEEDCINDGRHRKEFSLMADCSSLFAISCFFSPFIPLVAHLNIGAYRFVVNVENARADSLIKLGQGLPNHLAWFDFSVKKKNGIRRIKKVRNVCTKKVSFVFFKMREIKIK